MHQRNMPSLIEKEVIMVDKLVPTEFREANVFIPIEYKLINGRYIPTKFKEVPKFIFVDFKYIKVPILIPR